MRFPHLIVRHPCTTIIRSNIDKKFGGGKSAEIEIKVFELDIQEQVAYQLPFRKNPNV